MTVARFTETDLLRLTGGEDAAPDAPEPKRRDWKESRLQGWVDRLVDRVVLPPVFVTCIDLAGKESDLARVWAQGRGTKFGLPDHFIAQGDPLVVAWIELKIGNAEPTERQWSRIRAISLTGMFSHYTNSI